ncbi:MAG: CPBP family intramembrane glutamic endopeptidase [Acidobacteriota bacterium]
MTEDGGPAAPVDGDPDTDPGPPESHFYTAAWVFYLVLAILGILWVGYSADEIALSLFIDPERWWLDLLIGVGAGGVLLLGWSLLRDHSSAMRRVEAVMRETVGELDGPQIIAVALMSGFAEELFFRGAMQMSWGWPWALILFGVLHTGPEPSFRVWTIFAFVAGGLFAAITLWRGNLLAAIVAHVLVNGVNLWRLTKHPWPEPETNA